MIVTIADMERAVKATVGYKRGMKDEEANELAGYVLDFFGFSEEITDNKLSTEDRDVFYMLEEEGLLSTRQEETPVKSRGNPWRTHYWILKTKYIKELANNGDKGKKKVFIYAEMPDEIWARSSTK
jgi:hypothetical protein